MADPFEVRMRFTHQLQHLNASVTSAQKAAQYALKYKDMDEDLHSCILEQLEKNSMNNRANIMYFLEHLADMAVREGHHDYVRMMQRDILRVVDAVAPEDGSGAANVKVVRKVLQGLQAKSYLLPQTVTEIEECLKERDLVLPSHIGLSSPVAPDDAAGGDGGGDVYDSSVLPDAPDANNNLTNAENMTVLQSNTANANGTNLTSSPTSATTTKPPTKPTKPTKSASYPNASIPPPKLDKKQIEQRIEEDRERHKRLREHQWAVPFPVPSGPFSGSSSAAGGSASAAAAGAGAADPEFDRMWEETSSVGSDDYRLFEEEHLERKKCAVEHAEEMEGVFSGAQGASNQGGRGEYSHRESVAAGGGGGP